jgi:hypothetical protein
MYLLKLKVVQERQNIAEAQLCQPRRNPGELSPAELFAGLLEVT